MDSASSIAWHCVDFPEALERAGTHPQGLTAHEAARRLARHGPNRLEAAASAGWLRRLLSQFRDVLVVVLLAAGAVVLALGHVTDAVVIFAVTVLNALIGFVQEARAERALGAIRAMLAPVAVAIRDGRRLTLDAASLVRGDLVWLEAGERVPADLRLMEVRGLSVDESALTGESVPVDKTTAAVAPGTPMAERTGMAWSGTLVTRGTGLGVVVATGSATELGQLSGMVAGVTALETPLTRRLAQFGRRLTAVILGVAVLVFAVALARGLETGDAFLAVVGIAVAAIPEGLPAIVTIALAIGVRRMARRRAIVRHLPSVETLGSVTVICSDKTGTLTANQMMVARVVTAEGPFEITGHGYSPDGEVSAAGVAADAGTHPTLGALVRAAVLCNDADVAPEGGDWRPEGDPLEAALVAFALKAGVDPAAERSQAPRTDALPFDAERRWMATLHDDEGEALLALKGAPEAVLALCDRQLEAGAEAPLQAARWHAAAEELAAGGMRVIAVAARLAPAGRFAGTDMPRELVLVGLVGLIDPPRAAAVAAVARCQEAGIGVKMITGDHAATALAIARELSLEGAGRVVSGAEVEAASDQELPALVRDAAVFARAAPAHKLRIVAALQGRGEVVAMTGDGVNDAPALKRADVGVAMGLKGTAAAREAAAVVLADDDFATIAAAVEEGRTVYANIRKAIAYVLPTNGAQAASMVGAIFLGLPLPLSAAQVLWVNMVISVTLSLALAFEPHEPGVMRQRPRDPREPLLSAALVWRALLVAVLVAGGVLWLHQWELACGASEAAARTAAVNALVLAQLAYLFNIRAPDSGLPRLRLRDNPAVPVAVGVLLLLQAAFTWWAPFQAVFATEAPRAEAWRLALALAGAVFVVVELEKRAARALSARRRAAHRG